MVDDILISCTVASYNSSKTVLETLESIKAQTYRNIELIVSDDCSTDNTVELCRDWMEKNKDRFVRTELITVEKNTGVCENGNRAWRACRGVWQKGLAADDILLPNCVEDFVGFVCEHPDSMWVSSYVRTYLETFEEKNCNKRNYVIYRPFFDLPVEEQLKLYAIRNYLVAPSLFFKVDLKRELGGYNTNYVYEDYPFYLKALEHGYKCYFMDKETVCYRIHQSMSNSLDRLFNYDMIVKGRVFHEEQCFKHLTKRQIIGQQTTWKLQDIIVKLNLNKKNRVSEFLYYKLCALINRVFN